MSRRRKKEPALLVLAVMQLTFGAAQSSAQAGPLPEQDDWIDHGVRIQAGAPGQWDRRLSGMIGPCAFMKRGGTYYLYYLGASEDRPDGGPANRKLGVATSTNGIDFQKHAGNPIITTATFGAVPGWTNEAGVFSCGGFVGDDDIFYLYYGAMTERRAGSVTSDVRLATSDDGLNFTDRGIILNHSDSDVPGFGDELYPLGAFQLDGEFHVYYTAQGRGPAWGLGLARSTIYDSGYSAVSAYPGEWTAAGGNAFVVGPSASEIVLFLQAEYGTGATIKVRTAPTDSPEKLGRIVRRYRLGETGYPTVYRDEATNTWFMGMQEGGERYPAGIAIFSAPL